MRMNTFYQHTADDALRALSATTEGLTTKEADKRVEKYGPNALEQAEKLSLWQILWHNINNLIVYLLAGAAGLSMFMNEWVEAIAVLVALLIAVLTGFFVEVKAQSSVESLQRMIYTTTKVLRDGELKELPASALVPGDVIVLEEGDAISADARLLQSVNLAVVEAALTGESEAVEKRADEVFAGERSIGDRTNMLFSGTAVVRGNARAVVTATGMRTEVGQISALLNATQSGASPLERELSRLGKVLIGLSFVAALLVVIIGIVTGQPVVEVLHVAIILAIAAIPEALPAVSTITLSRGMKIMSEHKALVKSLSAVETLGATTVIASDKTGTLTENQMTAERVVLAQGRNISVSGTGYQPIGTFEEQGQSETKNFAPALQQPIVEDALSRFVVNGLMASNAQLRLADEQSPDATHDEYEVVGDPTEGALVVLAAKAGLNHSMIKANGWERVGEVPFNSDNKYMAVHYRGVGERLIIKGAPDVLIDRFAHNAEERGYWQEQNEHIATRGMRVLAVASAELPEAVDAPLEELLETYRTSIALDGLVGIVDPPREDVKEAVKLTQKAGITVKMITGDHPRTAAIIAQQIGIAQAENTMTGQEIDRLVGTPEFGEKVRQTAVFARVSPENKLQIVSALQAQGQVVAMTGDGVNDAPALSGADIGVAMGIRGTEVAKEASNMILTDDRFSTIVDAVSIGRMIFANIKKYVAFLFSCNMVEILAVLLSVIFIMPMPIQALHILFLNLVIDIGPALALAFEKPEDNIMQASPRTAQNGLVSTAFLSRIITNGAIIAIASFVVFNVAYHRGDNEAYAQTATFTFMAFAQLLHVLNVRKERGFGLDRSLWQNKALILALVVSAGLQLFAVYSPFMNGVIGTTPLTLTTWGYMGIGFFATTLAVYLVNRWKTPA